MKFRNPYHFVPVDGETDRCVDLSEDGRLGLENLEHRAFHRHHEGTFSGRLVCTVETEGPVAVGSGRTGAPGEPAAVHPFEREGRPALPASTLRGCASAVAEAASNSALRVLDDARHSNRVHLDDYDPWDYSALGMVVEVDGELRLRPLALPTLKKGRDEEFFTVPEKYRRMFPAPEEGEAPEWRFKAFCYEDDLESAPRGWSAENRRFRYAPLEGAYRMNGEHQVRGRGGKVLGDALLLGLNAEDDPAPRPPRTGGERWARGILRVLSDPRRRRDIPSTKRHEMFVPYPEGAEERPTFPVLPEALERFRRLASARETENRRRLAASREAGFKGRVRDPLPYVAKGDLPLRNRDPRYCPRDGDLVFFTPDETGEAVERLWISQVWREESPFTVHDFFAAVNPELTPFGEARRRVTPAELLFGFVEDSSSPEGESCAGKGSGPAAEAGGPSRGDRRRGRALASRVRFGDALLVREASEGPYHPWTVLRILASPKPPCPSFYFRKPRLERPSPSEAYVSKRDLRNSPPGSYVPQGRKFYLNHASDPPILEKCRTRSEDLRRSQKSRVRPLREGNRFLFRVDFDNLSEWELGLLAYALGPGPSFRHKLGMGKSLGLGTVRMEVRGAFYVDRRRRYSPEGLLGEGGGLALRYHGCWADEELRSGALRGFLEREEREALEALGSAGDDSRKAPGRLREAFARGMSPRIRKALEMAGRPGVEGVGFPVTAEQAKGGGKALAEEESFRWFQRNDRTAGKGGGQGLVPLEYGDDIPELEAN